MTHIELNSWVNDAVADNVASYKEYLMEWSIPDIVDHLAQSVVQGVEEAIIETNSLMHNSDKPAEISKLCKSQDVSHFEIYRCHSCT